MNYGWISSIGLLLLSGFIVGLLTPVMRIIALRFSILDSPSEKHKTHQNAIPYLGGVAIITSVVLVSVFASTFSPTPALSLKILALVLFPALIMGVVGLIDDIKKLSPWPRFLAQNLIGLFVSTILVTTDTVGSPTGSTFLDLAISILWIVGLSNAVNFFDNIDGGASGAIAISSFFLGALALQEGQFAIAALSMVLAGSTLGFLFWNRPPARIYMGDAGSLFLGLLIASLTLRFDPNPINKWASYSVPFLILAIPIMDTSVAVISRLASGKSPFEGGRDHLSHRLMRLGLSKRQAVSSLWLLSFFFSLLAFLLSQAPFSMEGLITVASLFMWFMALSWFLRKN